MTQINYNPPYSGTSIIVVSRIIHFIIIFLSIYYSAKVIYYAIKFGYKKLQQMKSMILQITSNSY